jgi:hypothetical protein
VKPGLYYDLPVAQYHADPCDAPSLSSSGIRTLLSSTPAHFAARHPKLTQWPDQIRVATKAQDLGTVVHRLVLERGSEYIVIDPSNFRNKDGTVATTFNNAQAKAAKVSAESQGLVVIDNDTYSQAREVADRLIAKLQARYGGWPIGQSEVTGIWQRQTAHGPIWCRMLLDHVSERAVTALDMKSTALSLDKDELPKSIANAGGDIQNAWYIDGLSTLFPQYAGLWQFVFMYGEVNPPYDVLPVKLGEGWLTRARHRINRACDLFALCMKRNEWPGWSIDEPLTLSAPSYLATKWEAEELEEAV